MTNKSQNALSSLEIMSYSLCHLLGGSETPIEQVPNIFDHYVDFHIRRNELRRQDRTASSAQYSGGGNYVTTFVAGQLQNQQMEFPAPGRYWDQSGLNLLHNAYAVYAAADLTSDFLGHLEKRRAAAKGAEVIYWELARAYAEFWNGEKENAATYFAKAVELSGQDVQLQFDLAQLYVQTQNIEDALAVLDRIQATDQKMVIQKETAILHYAQQLGDLDRAQVAAKRLFGMRIDSSAQIALAESMRRLGMNEEAEGVLKRAERQSSSRGAALVALMSQYLLEGKNEPAAEAAYRILRTSRVNPQNQQQMQHNPYGMRHDDSNRTAALQCLQQAGKLKDQIAVLEGQLERSPQSEQLYNSLMEFYAVAGETKKTAELQKKLLELRPDDADLRYRIAMSYAQEGQGKEACDLLLDAIRKKPSLAGDEFHQLIQVFRSTRRLPELGKLMTEIDLRKVGRYYTVQNLLQYLMSEPTTVDLALVLVKRAADAFPEQELGDFLRSSIDEDLLKNPELAALLRKSLVPSPEKAKRNPWGEESQSYSGDGSISSSAATLIENSGPEELSSLQADVEKTLKTAPKWHEGQVLLAMIAAQVNDQELARKQSKILAELDFNDYQATYGIWKAAQAYRKVPELRDEARKLYEVASKAWREQHNGSNGPATALVTMYLEAGEKETARKMLLARVDEPVDNNSGNREYEAYQRVSYLGDTAEKLEELGFHTDALRVYREQIRFGKQNDALIKSVNSDNSITRGGEQQLGALIRKLQESSDRSWVKELLQTEKTKGSTSPIELFIVEGETLADARQEMPYYRGRRRRYDDSNLTVSRYTSLLAIILKEKSASPALVTEIDSYLKKLAGEHPQDFQVAIAETLFAMAKRPEAQKAALDRLEKLVDATPLEEIPAGKRANSRQRAVATQQIPLWLVARECLAKPETSALGNKLANRALAASQRLPKDKSSPSIIFELAGLALKRGDLPAAEAAYRKLIEQSVTPKLVKSIAAPQPSELGPAELVPPEAPPIAQDPKNPTSRRAPVTMSQFMLAAAIAEKAADQGLNEVSLFAIREALSAGMPVADLREEDDPFGSRRSRFMASPSSASDALSGNSNIEAPLQQVLAVWSRAKLPPAEVSQILEQLVFPAARAREIMSFHEGSGSDSYGSSAQVNTGILGALAEWATLANRTAEIESQVSKRKGTLDSEIAGETLSLYLAIAKKDSAKVSACLKELEKRAELTKSGTVRGVIATALAHVFAHAEWRAEAAPVLLTFVRSSLQGSQGGDSREQAPLLERLLRYEIRQGRLPEAKTLIDAYLKSSSAFYARHSHSSAQIEYQYRNLLWAAEVVSGGGNLAATLEAAGRAADLPMRRSSVSDSVAIVVYHMQNQMRKLTAAERYTLLRDWSLPTAERRSIRSLSAPELPQTIPTEFVRELGLEYHVPQQRRIVGTLSLLIEAAQEAGKLDDLAAAFKALAGEKIPNADTLGLMLAVAQKDDASIPRYLAGVDERLNKFIEKSKAQEDDHRNRERQEASDYAELGAIISAAKVDSQRKPALALLEKFRTNRSNWTSQSGISSEFLVDAINRNDELRSMPEAAWAMPALRFWRHLNEGKQWYGGQPTSGLYACNSGLISLQSGDASALQFKYPLTGDWTFSFESKMCDFGYGGISSSMGGGYYNRGEDAALMSRQIETERAHYAFQTQQYAETSELAINRYVLRSKDGKLFFEVNGQSYPEKLLNEVTPSLSSPWIKLSSRMSAPAMIRNPRLTGTPTILKSVDLAANDQSSGWSNNYMDSVRGISDRATRHADTLNPDDQESASVPSKYEDVWKFENGEIHGPRDERLPATAASGIGYQRALANGETIAYEFFYEPGKALVHPVLGNLELLLKPEGVHLGWKASAPRHYRGSSSELVPESELLGRHLKADNAVPLKLKAGEWNQVQLSVAADELTLKINGQLALQRKLEPTLERELTLMHFPRESEFRVRKVILTGDWPETLTAKELENLLAWQGPPPTPEQATVAFCLLSDWGENEAAHELLAKSSTLAPLPRYEALRRFVLPNETQPRFQLNFRYNESFVPGKEIASPVIALFAAAKEAGKLPELKAELVRLSSTSNKPNSLHAEALLAMLAAGSGEAALANEKLKSVTAAVRSSGLKDLAATTHAACLAAHAGLQNPETRAEAAALVTALHEKYQVPEAQSRADLAAEVRILERLSRNSKTPAATITSLQFSAKAPEWIAYETDSASSALEKQLPRSSLWHVEPGLIEHLWPGKATTVLYQTPLTGDFVVTCKIRRSKGEILIPTYAGIAVYPKENGFAKVSAQGFDALAIPVENRGALTDWFDYKLEVASDFLTISINGKRVLQEKLLAHSDPFLRLRHFRENDEGGDDAAVALRDFKITGSPKTPATVTLSKGTALLGWENSFYAEPDSDSFVSVHSQRMPSFEQSTRNSTGWNLEQGEMNITGTPELKECLAEKLLSYQRPLIAGDEIELEFFYDPDKTEFSPAIGRTALLLRPEGLKTHRLTKLPYVVDELALDNEAAVKDAQPIKLQAQQWNKLKLSIQKETFKVFLNGQEIATLPRELSTADLFGIFRRQNHVGTKVKNVTLTGNWSGKNSK